MADGVNTPRDPVELSWWVAANLPLQDAQKLFLLGLVKELIVSWLVAVLLMERHIIRGAEGRSVSHNN